MPDNEKPDTKLTAEQRCLLLEALWRYRLHYPIISFEKMWTTAEYRDASEALDDATYISLVLAWTGLGYKTTYRSVVDAGLMRWVRGEPHDRHIGWLCLTEAGAKIIQQWIDEGDA